VLADIPVPRDVLAPQSIVGGGMLCLGPSMPRFMLCLDLRSRHTAGALAIQLIMKGFVLPVQVPVKRFMLIADLVMQILMTTDSGLVVGW
jgi:hypothetical protein